MSNLPSSNDGKVSGGEDTLPLVPVNATHSRIFPVAVWITLGIVIIALVITFFVFPIRNIQQVALLIPLWWMAISCAVGTWFYKNLKEEQGTYLIIGGSLSGLVFLSFVISGLGLTLGITGFLLTFSVFIHLSSPRKYTYVLAIGGLAGILAFFIDFIGSANRLLVPENWRIINLFTEFLLFLLLLWVIRKNFYLIELSVKFVMAFTFLSIISIGAVTMYHLNQSRDLFLQPDKFSKTAILVSLVIIILTSVAIVFFAQFILRPVVQLAKVSQELVAGNIDLKLPVERQDEVGILAKSINILANRLRETLDSLEIRVYDRTVELAEIAEQTKKQSSQFKAVSEIARSIASIQDIHQLLPLITQTISDRFGFYHVGIFLVDANREYAVLQAANSEGGQRMLSRGHRLKIGQMGIVGYVTDLGEPRIASDVGQDSTFFNNPDLPDTRSEMALPLVVRDLVIGALDVQSTEVGAFKEDDFTVLLTLADQVAIAIENARLFGTTRQALSEAQSAQREFLKTEWDQEIAKGQRGFSYTFGQLTPLSSMPEIKAEEALVVPIELRGQLIGTLKLEGIEIDHAWNEEEIALAKSVADQVGLALENARLLETTRRRAEREVLVGQITTKLRTSNDPETILQTAVSELTRVLRIQKGQVVIHSVSDQHTDLNQAQKSNLSSSEDVNGQSETTGRE